MEKNVVKNPSELIAQESLRGSRKVIECYIHGAFFSHAFSKDNIWY